MVEAGLAKATSNTMSNKKDNSDKSKLERVVELLKFALSLDDEEIMKSTIESVIEILEEEIGK
ncbi:MAG: hypothetical protein ACREBJ_00185 [Nitrosotalea sp.]